MVMDITVLSRKLLEEVKLCSEDIEQLNSRISDRLYQIHETVRYRTAIPTTQVYVSTPVTTISQIVIFKQCNKWFTTILVNKTTS